MNLLNTLRNAEPLCGNWYIKSYSERRGCFDIYTVENKLGNIVEMKVLVLPEGKDAGIFFELLKKVFSAGKSCENILKLYGYGSEEVCNNRLLIYTIYEIAEPIEEYLEKTRLTSGMISSIACDIAQALRECEICDICHGDISYKNIYFSKGKYKLGCFGEAELIETSGIKYREGINYCISPESQNGVRNIKSDIYSLGIIIYGLYNFARLPFTPSKDEKFVLMETAEKTAFEKRMKADNDVFPNPLYADEAAIEFINKCCAFAPENRYASAELLVEAAQIMRNDTDCGKTIEYPNFSAVNIRKRQEEEYMGSYYDESESKTESRTMPINQNITEEDRNNFTMGAQAVYTETMSRIRNNRRKQVDESVLEEIDRTEQKLAKKYGVDSMQYQKFIEKVQTYEKLQDNVTVLKKNNKKRETIIKILIGAAAVAVIAGVVLALNTNTFYINQGQYDRIYRRNFLGNVECFKSVPCDSLIKNGGRLYYIKSTDGKIYSTSAKTGDDEILITDDSAAEFKIVDEYIYYINKSDGQKLYRITTDGDKRSIVVNEACLSISVDKKTIKFITVATPEEPKLFDTKNGTIKNEYID